MKNCWFQHLSQYFRIGPKNQVILTWIQNIWATIWKSWKASRYHLQYVSWTEGKKEQRRCKLITVERTSVVLSHRRVDLINLFVFGYGVIDPFLDGQDVVFIAQVTGGLPCDLDPPRCWQGCQIHSCSRLNTETHFEKPVSMESLLI